MNVYSGITPKSAELAKKISEITPGGLSRSFFCQGGSEANESSLKLAQAFLSFLDVLMNHKGEV